MPDSLRLYRGLRTYRRDEGVVRTITFDRPFFHRPQYSTTIKPIDILTRYEEPILSSMIDSETNRIKLTCTPSDPAIIIRDSTDTIVTVTINSIGEEDGLGYIEVLPEDIIRLSDKTTVFIVSYLTTLKNFMLQRDAFVRIIPESLLISVDGTVLSYDRDYRIDWQNFVCHILPTSVYYKMIDRDTDGTIIDMPLIAIQYSITDTRARGSASWSTWCYASETSTIVILPFTPSEASSGNYHLIDDVDVSFMTSYTIEKGWHSIQTTQPIPTNKSNSLDVNQLTKLPSNAGIVIPDTVAYRAYRESMRYVTPNILATVPLSDSEKCFTMMNGKIYTLFVPEYYSQAFLNRVGVTSPSGKTLLAKLPLYSSPYTCVGYIEQPEMFQLEFDYGIITEDNSVVDSIVIRAEASGSSNDTLVISKFGINKLVIE